MAFFERFQRKSVNNFFSNICRSRKNQIRVIELDRAQAIPYYLQIGPVADAVDLVSSEIANIVPVMQDTKSGVFIEDHPLLTLLDNPNTNETYSDFIKQFVLFYLVTGNNYLLATGPVGVPPVELSVIRPQTVTITPSDKDGRAQTYIVTGAADFERNGSQFRFFTRDQTAEIYQSKIVNPRTGTSASAESEALYGLSPLTPHIYDLELYRSVCIHNIALLKNGARPSTVFQAKNKLTEEQQKQMQASLEQWYEGEANAGRPVVVGGGFDIEVLNETARDMDYATLKRQVTESIFRTYKIPLPLISSESMTLSNYTQANLVFYLSAVLPLLNYIFQQITNFLLPRYPRSDGLILTYKSETVLALEPLRMQRLKDLDALKITTINEMRLLLNFGELAGGTDVYRPATDIPVASSTGVAPERPVMQTPTDTSVKFIDLMKQQIDHCGNRVFSDTEIDNMVSLEFNHAPVC